VNSIRRIDLAYPSIRRIDLAYSSEVFGAMILIGL
jgi:hypothetical protein